jgi:CheY-like chemotaxis protein
MTGAPTAASVLVVEDNPAMRAFLRSLVEEMGLSVHECADGDEAVERYALLRPDWVLMDVKLEGTNGIAATRAIRRSDPNARVIVVTEHRDAQYRRAAYAAGAVGFVLKEDLLELPALITELERAHPDAGGSC